MLPDVAFVVSTAQRVGCEIQSPDSALMGPESLDTEPVVFVPHPHFYGVVEGSAEESQTVWFELQVLHILSVFQQTRCT